MVTLQQFADGAKGYLQSGVIPHLPEGKQFVSGVTLGVISYRIDRTMQVLKDNALVKALGLIENDMIDDDALFAAMREQMNRQGSLRIDIPWIGNLTFTAPDIDALQRSIRGR